MIADEYLVGTDGGDGFVDEREIVRSDHAVGACGEEETAVDGHVCQRPDVPDAQSSVWLKSAPLRPGR